MKKFLTLVFAVCCSVLKAQDFEPQNSIAIFAGPNWVEKLNADCIGCGSYNSKIGYTFGIEYALDIAAHWQVKIGVRYNVLNSEYQSDFFPFPIPPTPSQGEKRTDKVWQYLAGVRFLGKPKTWSWYADADAGLADFIEPNNTPKTKLRFSVGAGVGLAWQPVGKNTAVFVQPVVRYVFSEPNSVFARGGYAFLVPAIETGVRQHF